MNKKLHVGNLVIWVTDQELSEKFARFGLVDFAVVFKDETSVESCGFGLVDMSDVAGAKKAIEWLNFSTHEGRIMTVSPFKGQNVAH
jgi:RNA recognition motif-containing protein